VILLSLFACSQKAPELSQQEIDAILSEVEANVDRVVQAANNLSTSALEEYLTDGPEANFYMSGAAYSKQDLIDITKEEFSGFTSQNLSIVEHNIRFIQPTTVLYTAQMKGDSTDNQGYQESMNYTETWLWEKQDGRWQVSHLHESWE
jgi:ketosteroid isomerase-like protein